MIIKSARFVLSCEKKEDFPVDDFPQIAFVGRSNVGKSSLLNVLVQQNRLAFTSRTPGRTQLINYFVINDALYFVDLPGYGYAKVPTETHKKWQPMIESYFAQAKRLRGVIVLLDARHESSPLDAHMMQYLLSLSIPLQPVATKIDKLGNQQRMRNLAALKQTVPHWMDTDIIAFSAKTREGREPLLEAIGKMLAH